MTTDAVREAWCRVGDELEALGLKLRLHFEQEQSDGNDHDDHDVESTFERLGRRLDDAVDALDNAAGDDAVRDDLREVGHRFVEAATATFRTARDEVRRAAER